MMQFTPPVPVREDYDPFAHVFMTKSYLDGLWPKRPDYTEVRIGVGLKFRFETHPRLQRMFVSAVKPKFNSIFGIPLVVDETMPDNVYTISFIEPGGTP